ncbi:MAG: hypothetical protein ACYCPS_00215 [Candidatus Saccharimonadales bacterium]
MPVICPTITASNEVEYLKQLTNIELFANRVHIDLMDGQFAPSRSVPIDKLMWPTGIKADIHLMYKKPLDCLSQLVKLKPNMVIIHYEAEVDHALFAKQLKEHFILSGLAILEDTPVAKIESLVDLFDQILVFGGNLGYQGGQADLRLTKKVNDLRSKHPDLEIAWDGGVNDQNIQQLAVSGVDVFNVGAYIQKSVSSKEAYAKLLSIIS